MKTMLVMTVVGVCALAGCSSNTSGTPTRASTTAPATTAQASNTKWDPCQLSDADITAAGLSPATKGTGSGGVTFPGWDICSWASDSWFTVGVYNTTAHSYSEVIGGGSAQLTDPRPVTVAGRAATMMNSSSGPHGCDIIFDTTAGPVQIEVDAKLSHSDDQGIDTCAQATQVATALAKDLPAQKN